jgi:hypothetical protein
MGGAKMLVATQDDKALTGYRMKWIFDSNLVRQNSGSMCSWLSLYPYCSLDFSRCWVLI